MKIKLSRNKEVPKEIRFMMYKVLLNVFLTAEIEKTPISRTIYINFNSQRVGIALYNGFCNHFEQLCSTYNKICIFDYKLPIMFPEFEEAAKRYKGKRWWFNDKNWRRRAYLEKILK